MLQLLHISIIEQILFDLEFYATAIKKPRKILVSFQQKKAAS